MAKPHITRTFGPIHFEDLDPHRFEDLVRQLVYDFKQWQSIESTGRGGSDDGFDIRAYEQLQASDIQEEFEDEVDRPHPMEGNLWMIQCKREKQLGPKRIDTIICDAVNPDAPPYGYILAAPAHFSKAAHDKFREELRSRGVMEFSLWGAGELEDMLYQPKNDHILFAFFGISLVSRRRSRTTDIRSSVNIKNKLRRVLGDDPNGTILIRNLQDTHYPYESEYNDFDKKPRWKAFSTTQFHPLGLIVSVGRSYAYIDKSKKEWDYANVNNIMPQRGHYQKDHNDEKRKLWIAAKGFWEQLPHENKATFVYEGLIRFDSIALVDDKGDVNFDFPHIFVDFREGSPFAGWFEHLELNKYEHMYLDELKQIDIFPDKFPTPKFGKIYKNKCILVDDGTVIMLRRDIDQITLYDFDDKYNYLKPTDVIAFDKSEGKRDGEKLLKITNVRTIKGKALTQDRKSDTWLNNEIERQISRKFKSTDSILILEAVLIGDWQIEQNRPVI